MLNRLTTMRLLPGLLLVGLAGCATIPPAPPAAAPPPPPPGLGRIIGQTVDGVTRLLGPASRDRSEGPARLLQFIRQPCVLDVFLYPGSGATLVVRTAAARRPDGSRIDPGACLSLIVLPAASAR